MGSVAYNPPEGKNYKWYISGIFPANWGVDYVPPIYWYHLLGEPVQQPLMRGFNKLSFLLHLVAIPRDPISSPYLRMVSWNLKDLCVSKVMKDTSCSSSENMTIDA